MAITSLAVETNFQTSDHVIAMEKADKQFISTKCMQKVSSYEWFYSLWTLMKSQKVVINTALGIGIDSQETRHVVAMEELAYFYKIL